MKWRMHGRSSSLAAPAGAGPNTITVHLGAAVDAAGIPTGPVLGTAAVAADGSWAFDGQAPLLPGTDVTISVVSSNNVVLAGIPLVLR